MLLYQSREKSREKGERFYIFLQQQNTWKNQLYEKISINFLSYLVKIFSKTTFKNNQLAKWLIVNSVWKKL